MGGSGGGAQAAIPHLTPAPPPPVTVVTPLLVDRYQVGIGRSRASPARCPGPALQFLVVPASASEMMSSHLHATHLAVMGCFAVGVLMSGWVRLRGLTAHSSRFKGMGMAWLLHKFVSLKPLLEELTGPPVGHSPPYVTTPSPHVLSCTESLFCRHGGT